MLCCLKTRASMVRISSPLTGRPSIRLTTMRRYASSGVGQGPGLASGSQTLAGGSGLGSVGVSGTGPFPRPLAITVLLTPIFPAVLPLIVRDTPLGGLAFTVGLAASKGTPQVPEPRIARDG